MNKERFEKQLGFILEADKEKNILRQTHLADTADEKMMPNTHGNYDLFAEGACQRKL